MIIMMAEDDDFMKLKGFWTYHVWLVVSTNPSGLRQLG
jgi:hypothetical protein